MTQDYTPEDVFEESYYLDGVKAGLSNYVSYEWKEELTMPMAKHFRKYLDINSGHQVHDYGCARGYFVKALRRLGIYAKGSDLSAWAIENCDPEVKSCVSNDLTLEPLSVDWIHAKDVLEHIEYRQLVRTVQMLLSAARVGVFIVVPLTNLTQGMYLRIEDQMDVTHKIRWTMEDWLKFLQALGQDFTVNGSYHIPGLKEASTKVPYSCGFFTLRRN